MISIKERLEKLKYAWYVSDKLDELRRILVVEKGISCSVADGIVKKLFKQLKSEPEKLKFDKVCPTYLCGQNFLIEISCANKDEKLVLVSDEIRIEGSSVGFSMNNNSPDIENIWAVYIAEQVLYVIFPA